MGLADQQVEGIRITALIHDIGKFAIPAEILTKPTALKPQEYDLLRTHGQEGYDVIKQISFPWPVASFACPHRIPALVSSGTDVNSTGGKKKDPIADASGLSVEGTQRP